MIWRAWPQWLKIVTSIDALLLGLAGILGTLLLTASLLNPQIYITPLDKIAIVIKHLVVFQLLPLLLVAGTAFFADGLQRRNLVWFAYAAMTLPVLAVPTLFWESFR